MSRRSTLLSLAAAFGLALLTACSIVSEADSHAVSHPQALEPGRPMCTTCHGAEPMKDSGKTFAALDHTEAFVKNHSAQAGQGAQACATCHAPSFCTDCHAGKTPMTPSTKLGDRPDRAMPHRAGYLTLHRIEGKVDPTGCYKCHGRANNDKCRACHR